MPQAGQKSLTLGGETLRRLKEHYVKENSESPYPISFAQFISSHALNDIARKSKEKTKRN